MLNGHHAAAPNASAVPKWRAATAAAARSYQRFSRAVVSLSEKAR